MDEGIVCRKRRIRSEMKKILASLGAEEYAGKSGKICGSIFSSSLWAGLSVLAAFLPLPGEPDLRPLLGQALAGGKKVCLPRIEGEDIVFHFVSGLEENLASHAWGISEPAAYLPQVRPEDFGKEGVLFLVPGLAFDRQGHRLGRGKGFYDRFFSRLAGKGIHPPVFGAAFSCQILGEVPADENDFPLSGLVSEECGLLLFQKPVSASGKTPGLTGE
jgi:5-formyltetrahydrofolate cyclo-ligase